MRSVLARRRSKSVQFAQTPIVTTTYGQSEYMRDAWDERRITARELSRIQTELDEFKLLEMDIHEESIQNTYLHKRYI
jgi:hypothetical protein